MTTTETGTSALRALIKPIIIWGWLSLLSGPVFSQSKYFVLREDFPYYKTKKYELDTEDLYQVKKRIELFNIFPNSPKKNTSKAPTFDQDIILFSVLPDFKSTDNWTEVKWEHIKQDTLSYHDLLHLKYKALFQIFDQCYDETTKYLNEYTLVVQKDDRYFVAKNTLLQFYAIRTRPTVFNAPFGTINILQDTFSVREMADYYKEIRQRSNFPLESFLTTYSSFDRIRDRKEFLSKKFAYKGEEAYQFWTYTDWHRKEYYYETERGIDRFVYIPEKGIVGGSFDFYFFFHRKDIDLNLVKFKENIYDEKIMLAEDI